MKNLGDSAGTVGKVGTPGGQGPGLRDGSQKGFSGIAFR